MTKAIPIYTTQRNMKRYSLRGFSILEVLIALIVLSVGMLGAVGMQTAAMQANKETRNQAVATSFARELADMMRGNYAVALRTTTADNPYLLADTTLTGTATFSPPAENCFTSACTTSSTVATWDVAEWQNRLQNSLPDPRVKVCFDATPFDSAGVPQWACTDTGDISVLKLAWTRNQTNSANADNTNTPLQFSSDAKPLVIVPLTAGTPQ